jgi:hypothetical protein
MEDVASAMALLKDPLTVILKRGKELETRIHTMTHFRSSPFGKDSETNRTLW